MDWGAIGSTAEAAMRELALFAACGFLLLGAGDLAVDLVWLARAAKRRLLGLAVDADAGALPPPADPRPIAIFVPAWDEATVIGAMLRHAGTAFAGADCRLYIGAYPNDPATIAAVRAAAGPDVRLVIAGDGGLAVHLGELASLAGSGAPVIVLVFNDGHLVYDMDDPYIGYAVAEPNVGGNWQ